MEIILLLIWSDWVFHLPAIIQGPDLSGAENDLWFYGEKIYQTLKQSKQSLNQEFQESSIFVQLTEEKKNQSIV